MNANSWRFFENPPCGYRQALLAAPGAHIREEGAREAGVPHRRQPPSSLDSAALPSALFLKHRWKFVPLPFLGRVFDFLVHDRKSSLLCQPLIRC